MGSAEVHVDDDAIHVGSDARGVWWAVGKEGSYGGSHARHVAIRFAVAASATGFHGTRRIVVHDDIGGGIAFVITRTRTKASAQFEQDNVP